MTEPNEFIETYIKHWGVYDPVEAHKYYIENRQLKGKGDPRAYKDGFGNPLPKLGTKFNEDESPLASPGGNTKLLAYGGGKDGSTAKYADGWVYDSNKGWVAPKAKVSTRNSKARVETAQKRLDQVKSAVQKASPTQRAALTQRVDTAQNKLKSIRGLL